MFCFLLLLNFIMIEIRQLSGLHFSDYLSFKKIVDLGFIVCSLLLLVGNFYSHHPIDKVQERIDLVMTIRMQRLLASCTAFPLFIKLVNLMKIFNELTFYIKLVIDTITGIWYFLIIMFICMCTFATSFYMIDLNNADDDIALAEELGEDFSSEDESKLMYDNYRFWLFDAFTHVYQTMIGEFSVDAYSESENNKYLYNFFILCTFFTMIVFLNMAIAIMGDIFAQAMEQRPMNTRLSEINSLADYVNVIGNEKAKTFRGRKNAAKNSNAAGGPSADKNYMLLYAVETDRESMFDEGAGWEGQVNIIKKFTESKINQAHDSLMINNMKLLEH